MDKQEFINIGGNVEQALQGNYNISVKGVLSEAWQVTAKSRLSITLALFMTLAFGTLVSFLMSEPLGGIENVLNDQRSLSMVNIVVTLAVSPLIAGVEMMGILHAIGIKTTPRFVFKYLSRGSWVALCALLTSTLVTIGIQLLVIPGIFLLVALSLALPLVVEKKLSPLRAIVLSVQVLRFQWFRIFSIYVILLLVLIATTIPLSIFLQSDLAIVGIFIFLFTLSYLAPLFYNVKGILYREIFGIQVHNSKVESTQSDDSFLA